MVHKNGLTLIAGLLFATVVLSAAPSAQAGQCSLAGAAGKYGFTLSGALLLPTGPVPGGAVGTLNVDAEGKISGTEARNVGGGFANETIKGQWTVNSDCTASASFPKDTETFYLVFVNRRTIAVTVSKAGVVATGALLKRQLDWPEVNR